MKNIADEFEHLYRLTYDNTLFYVLTKCGKIPEVEDILQDTYAELFQVLTDKGSDYISIPKGFVIQLAKSKVYRYFSEKERKQANIYMEPVELLDADNVSDTLQYTEKEAWDDTLIDKLTAKEVMGYLAEKDGLTKEIFFQHYFQDKTLKEIAENCNMKETTVKKRLYSTLKELRGMKRFALIIIILLMVALLAKPVYIWAEDMMSQIMRYLTQDTQNTLGIIALGSMYRDYKKLIDNGELPSDIHININGEDYTMERLEEIWVENPWLNDLDWDGKNASTGDEIDSYVVIYEDGNSNNEAEEAGVEKITLMPTKTPDK